MAQSLAGSRLASIPEEQQLSVATDSKPTDSKWGTLKKLVKR